MWFKGLVLVFFLLLCKWSVLRANKGWTLLVTTTHVSPSALITNRFLIKYTLEYTCCLSHVPWVTLSITSKENKWIFNPQNKTGRHFLSSFLKQQGNVMPIYSVLKWNWGEGEINQISFHHIPYISTCHRAPPVHTSLLYDVSCGQLQKEKRGIKFKYIWDCW